MSMRTRWFAGVVAIMAFVTVGAAQQTKSAAPAAQSKDAAAKETTWTGKISDAHCGAKKHSMSPDADCVTQCVKNGEYVFVGDKDKVYKIGNQKFVDLPKHAGHTVELTGTMKDDSITITKIAMPKAK